MSARTYRIADVIEAHKYALPGGACACGADLEAEHGGYQKAWRRHLADALEATATEREAAVLKDAASVLAKFAAIAPTAGRKDGWRAASGALEGMAEELLEGEWS